ncbi:MAG: hypothetical protein HY438_02390 [DPANN group archaeon]|nr:hypothetical protein [DPANN group archaeon]
MEYENLDDIVFALKHYSMLLDKFPDNITILSGKIEILEGLEGNLEGKLPLYGPSTVYGAPTPILTLEECLIECYDKMLLICKDEFLKNKTLQKKLLIHIKQKDKREFLLATSRYKDYASAAYHILRGYAKAVCDAREREFFYDWLLELRPCDETAALEKALALAERDVSSALDFSKQKFENKHWGHYIRASIFRKLGQYELAIGHLNVALNSKPDSAKMFEQLRSEKIVCLLALKKIDEAVNLAPNNLQKAQVYYGANDLPNTVRYATKAIEEERSSELPYMLIGRARYGQGKFSDAAKWLRQWTTLAPQNAEAWYWLGQSVLKSDPHKINNLRDALACLEKARELKYADVSDREISLISERINVLEQRRWV